VNTYSSDPLDTDSDDDGLLDGAEVSTHLTDPIDADSDDDGLSDSAEINTHLTNPNSSDSDSDQLSDLAEISTHLTDPTDADSDDDGLIDGIEINTYSSNPLSADTSGDGFNDGFIVGEGLNPTSDYSALRTSTISNVVSNSEAYGLYRLVNVKDFKASFKINHFENNLSAIVIEIIELVNNDFLQEIASYSLVNSFDGNYDSIYPYSNSADDPHWISTNYGFIDLNSNENIYLRNEILSDYVLLADLINQTEGQYNELDYASGGLNIRANNANIWGISPAGEILGTIGTNLSIPILLDSDTKFFRFKMAE
jgi:hypothetical protein